MNSRLVAARVLTRVLKQGQSLTVALDSVFKETEPAQEQAFIQALCFGVCRYYFQLDFIARQLLNKPLRNKDTEIKALILIGLYQLKYMRVKPHAAVSETVAAAGKKIWAKSLLNAVLRKYQREQTAIDILAEKDQMASTSHPDWLVKQIKASWPEQAEQIIQANNQQPPMVLRVNQARLGRDDYIKQLAAAGIEGLELPLCLSAIKLKQAVTVDKLPGFADGLVSVQDSAAQLAAGLLSLKTGQRVLDICAAPGGKTAHILEQPVELTELWAIDIDQLRLQRVEENLKRLKLHAKLLTADAAKPELWWDGRLFDRILLDAPCSALGVIRRHPDIKLLRREEDIAALQELQQAILKACWQMLAPGGLLVYATCSILKQENENQILQFLTEHDDAQEQEIVADWGIKRPAGRQVLTGDQAMDGFYYACVKKTA